MAGSALARRIAAELPKADVVIVEPWPHALAQRLAERLPNLRYAPGMPETADLVIAQDVLEHVVDPLAVFARLLEAVKPGGAVVAAKTSCSSRPRRRQAITGSLHRNDPAVRSLGLVPSGLGSIINRSDADIVHLHGLGAEAISLGEITGIRKPVVWTLLDLWPILGAQHYEGGDPDPIGRWVLRRKRRAWASLDVWMICPSRWIAAEASREPSFRLQGLEMIAHDISPTIRSKR